MMKKLFSIALLAVFASSPAWAQGEEKELDEAWRAFHWEDLVKQSGEAEGPWYPFLNVSTLSVGLYEIPAGGQDNQSPHERDEVYYVAEGAAMLRVEDDDIPVERGSVVYVRAKAPHHFHSITEGLKVVVFFSSAEPPKAPGPRGSMRRKKND